MNPPRVVTLATKGPINVHEDEVATAAEVLPVMRMSIGRCDEALIVRGEDMAQAAPLAAARNAYVIRVGTPRPCKGCGRTAETRLGFCHRCAVSS